MLSTNVILLVMIVIGFFYLHCNKNFREGATTNNNCPDCCVPSPCPDTCPTGMEYTGDSHCTDETCSNCCVKDPPKCTDITCPNTTIPKNNGADYTCTNNPCSIDECCAGRAMCSTVTCDYTHYIEDPEKLCAGTECTSADNCCVPDPTCSGFECSEGTSLVTNADEKICTTRPCSNKECCVENQKCGQYTCPTNEHESANNYFKACNNLVCTDKECCSENPYCSTFSCPSSYYYTGKLIENASQVQCKTYPCSPEECCTFSPTGKLPKIKIWPKYKE